SQLGQSDLGRIGVEDARVSLRRLGERPERDPLAVREAAALDKTRGKPLDELGEQARLANAGGAEEGDELRCALALGACRNRAEDCELLVSPDQRRAQAGDAAWFLFAGGYGYPGSDGRALSLRLQRLVLAIRDRAARRRLCPLPYEHLTGLRVLLQAGGNVDGVSADHQLASCGRFPARDHFARIDADPQADVGAVAAVHPL